MTIDNIHAFVIPINDVVSAKVNPSTSAPEYPEIVK